MERKYNIGDKVRIVSRRTAEMNPFGDMDCYLGEVMTISSYSTSPNCYRMEEDDGGYRWTDDMIAGLAEPELTAEEVLQAIRELPYDFVREFLGCDQGYTREYMLTAVATPKQVIEMCQRWKPEHEKKMKAEWSWQGYILEAGSMKVMQSFDTCCERRESAEEHVAVELNKFRMFYEGNYVAAIERVCRIKEEN